MRGDGKIILILGGSGFIAERVGELLCQAGYNLRVLSRRPETVRGNLAFPAEVFLWDGSTVPDAALDGCYGVINLAGESIAEGRWDQAKKKRIEHSRVDATAALAAALRRMQHLPEVVLQGSAVGIYGGTVNERKTEDDGPGQGFLAQVGKKWEEAAQGFPSRCRVVRMRTGMVFGWSGGALPELAAIYSSGLGAVLGDGKQWLNWIHIDDVASFIVQALEDERYSGVYNLVAPGNATNGEFHRMMAKYFCFASPLAVPKWVLKLVLGEKAVIVLDGAQIVPQRLTELGFSFQFQRLTDALMDLFGKREYPDAFVIQRKQFVPFTVQDVWPFFSTEKNLEQLTPPWLNFHVVGKSTPEIQQGCEIVYKLKLHGLPMSWRSKILIWTPFKEFIDFQVSGPYRIWHHRHSFQVMGNGVQLVDFVQYKLPLFPLSVPVNFLVLADVKKIFSFRQQEVKRLFDRAK